MEKKEARTEIKRRLKSLTNEERKTKSEKALELLVSLEEFRTARVLLLFVSMDDEIDTLPTILHALNNNKQVILPKCRMEDHELILCPVNSIDDLAPGAYGILEPTTNASIAASELDFILLPARAFDEQGNRLGRGAGFYDRLLSDCSLNATLCGIAYEEQILPSVPNDSHDKRVDIVVTDHRVRQCHA